MTDTEGRPAGWSAKRWSLTGLHGQLSHQACPRVSAGLTRPIRTSTAVYLDSSAVHIDDTLFSLCMLVVLLTTIAAHCEVAPYMTATAAAVAASAAASFNRRCAVDSWMQTATGARETGDGAQASSGPGRGGRPPARLSADAVCLCVCVCVCVCMDSLWRPSWSVGWLVIAWCTPAAAAVHSLLLQCRRWMHFGIATNVLSIRWIRRFVWNTRQRSQAT